MDKFKGHGVMLNHDYRYWLVAMLNVEPNKMIMILEPFRNGIDKYKIMSGQSIKLTDEEQDMIFNKNISPDIKYKDADTFFEAFIVVSVATHFCKLNTMLSIPCKPGYRWAPYRKDNILDPYEYKQIGQYFCRIPKTNKIYLDMVKDDDKYIKIWLLLVELHDIRAKIVWNMITLNRLNVDNCVDIY